MEPPNLGPLNGKCSQVKAQADSQQSAHVQGSHRYQRQPSTAASISFDGQLIHETHEYLSPAGVGWVMRFFYTVNGNTYFRSFNTGPEAWRNKDWVQLPS